MKNSCEKRHKLYTNRDYVSLLSATANQRLSNFDSFHLERMLNQNPGTHKSEQSRSETIRKVIISIASYILLIIISYMLPGIFLSLAESFRDEDEGEKNLQGNYSLSVCLCFLLALLSSF